MKESHQDHIHNWLNNSGAKYIINVHIGLVRLVP